MTEHPEVLVDCRGVRIPLSEITTLVGGVPFRFVISPERKARRRFTLGLFANGAAYSDEVHRYPVDQRICALLESPLNSCYRDVPMLERRFRTIYTHQKHLLDQGRPFAPLWFGTNWLGLGDSTAVDQHSRQPIVKSELVSFIGSIAHPNQGAYEFRRAVAELLKGRGDVNCYGRGIHEIPAKEPALAPYRFSVAMENAASDFYFSEKLIDCVLLEVIPVYFGCPGIGTCFDKRGILTFESTDELVSIIDRLTPELYERMLPFARQNRRTVIEKGWYSHSSLFARIAENVPPDVLRLPPVRNGRSWGLLSRFRKAFRLLLSQD